MPWPLPRGQWRELKRLCDEVNERLTPMQGAEVENIRALEERLLVRLRDFRPAGGREGGAVSQSQISTVPTL